MEMCLLDFLYSTPQALATSIYLSTYLFIQTDKLKIYLKYIKI